MRRLAATLVLPTIAAFGTAALADGLDVKVASITSPVHPGGRVTLVIQTQPGAACEGRRQDHYGNEIPLRPPSQQAGSDGRVTWAWNVLRGMHPVGRREIHVTCTSGKSQATLDAEFVVN